MLTGATSGIGHATARLLAPRTSRLFVHGPQRLSQIAGLLADLRAASRGEVHYVQADFDHLAAVEKLAAEITNRTDRVDVLVNNAGRPGPPRRTVSRDGNEATLQANYLAAVLLTERLTPLVLAADGRVVHVASATHLSASLDPEDLNLERSAYSPVVAYARSKLALVAHARWLAEQAPRPQPDIVSLHPGIISTSLLHAMFNIGGASVQQGARNVIHAALCANCWQGQYLDETQPTPPNPAALDGDFRRRLAERTRHLLAGLGPG
ncbi:SDR family NAD(P)-dependent oxidoreductase [Nonomuraea sp. H19]|uniref:SDR family NAD(P)-dependent oxidoreductase n=1 Tax=Nonomuraea sp. H19 TaxID=3452206 RepID=UPI003F8A0BAA